MKRWWKQLNQVCICKINGHTVAIYVTVRLGLGKSEIHFTDGYYSYTCDLPFHTGKAAIARLLGLLFQIINSCPCKKHTSYS